MSFLRSLGKGLRALLRKTQAEEEMDEELRGYLDAAVEEKVRAGMSEAQAVRAARIEMGSMEAVKEEIRTAGWESAVETVWQDLRYGVRILRKDPGFTLVAVLTLALSIGVNTTIFSVVSSMLLRKPPVDDPDRLVMLLSKAPAAVWWGADRRPVSAPDFLDWRAQATAYSGIAAASSVEDTVDFALSGGTEPERVPGNRISANYFQVLGVIPVLGRAFLPGEEEVGHDRVMVLREDLWKRHFGADPHVLGRAVKLNGENYTVVGIMPDSFRRMWMFPAQLWIPLAFTPAQVAPAARGSRALSVFARLKHGVTESEALAELITIAGRVAAANPETEKGWSANLMTVQKYAIQESNSKTALLFLTAAVGFVLLIACANLANLLLARNSSRQREFAVRTALGAGGFRLARQLLSECLILSLAGGGLGLLIALWGVHLLRAALNWNEYAVLTAEMLSIDSRVLIFTLAVSVTTALLFGLAPALRISRRDPSAGLKEGSRTTTAGREHHRLQNLLVIGELALSLILLVGAGLFVGFFTEEIHSERGMNPHNLLTASVSLSGAAYKEPARQVDFFQSVLRRLAGSPEVQSAAVTTDLPFTFPGSTHFTLEGRPVAKPDEQPSAGYFAVSPGYFGVVQIPLRAGREFTPSDNAGSAPVIIVNEAFAQKFFPNENPLGRHISVSHQSDDGSNGKASQRWNEIVGVVGNVNEFLGQTSLRPHIFEPFLQRPDHSMNVVVRVEIEPGAFAGSLRKAVWSVDKDQPVTDLRTMDRVVRDAGQGDDLMAELMGAFAGIALVMAAVGIYGLINYLVGRRTHEIGVRMALGARRVEVLILVLRHSMSLVLAGVGIGWLASLAMPRLVTASFSGFHVHSGWILIGTPLAVMLVALASCYVPARRATRVDPMTALKYE
ncbi:MAG: ADOP family duplicated permease [Terriglobia bacterium]